MPEHRYAAILESMLAPTLGGRWRFAVASSPSDLRVIGEKLESALEQYRPDALMLNCPTGPASFFINYPRWMNLLRSMPARFLEWRKESAVALEIRNDSRRERTRRDVLREGRFIDSVYRSRLSSWPALRRLRAHAGRRYGVVVKTTSERYVERLLGFRTIARDHMQGPILFVGVIPLSDNLYPGFHQRAHEWNRELNKHLPDTAQRCFFIDVMEELAVMPSSRLLLNDETHLSIEGHRRFAELLLPELRRLIQEAEADRFRAPSN